MSNELDNLTITYTWELMDLLSSKAAVGCKWIYKIKTLVDRPVECFKAHLVAKGFTQEYNIE